LTPWAVSGKKPLRRFGRVAGRAGIWVTGAIGIACGFGQSTLAFLITVLAIVILIVFDLLEKIVAKHQKEQQ